MSYHSSYLTKITFIATCLVLGCTSSGSLGCGSSNENGGPTIDMPEKTAIGTSEGATGSYQLAPSGAIRNITIAPPHDKMNPDGIRGMIRATAHGLPAEPVGIGATWRVDEVLPRQKYPVTVSSTVELLALKGEQIELRFESEAARVHRRANEDGAAPLTGALVKREDPRAEGTRVLTVVLTKGALRSTD